MLQYLRAEGKVVIALGRVGFSLLEPQADVEQRPRRVDEVLVECLCVGRPLVWRHPELAEDIAAVRLGDEVPEPGFFQNRQRLGP
jgi:hypothetical protein